MSGILENPVLSSLVGVVVGFLLSELREHFRTRRLNRKRRVVAYRQLKEFVDRIASKSPITDALLSDDELEKIGQAIANNYDVLDDSTLQAWGSKKIKSITGEKSVVDLARFHDDLRIHCDRFKKDNPYRHLA